MSMGLTEDASSKASIWEIVYPAEPLPLLTNPLVRPEASPAASGANAVTPASPAIVPAAPAPAPAFFNPAVGVMPGLSTSLSIDSPKSPAGPTLASLAPSSGQGTGLGSSPVLASCQAAAAAAAAAAAEAMGSPLSEAAVLGSSAANASSGLPAFPGLPPAAKREEICPPVNGGGNGVKSGDPRGSRFGAWVTERGPALCGTFGCMLPNNHPGLHQLPDGKSEKRARVSSKVVKDPWEVAKDKAEEAGVDYNGGGLARKTSTSSVEAETPKPLPMPVEEAPLAAAPAAPLLAAAARGPGRPRTVDRSGSSGGDVVAAAAQAAAAAAAFRSPPKSTSDATIDAAATTAGTALANDQGTSELIGDRRPFSALGADARLRLLHVLARAAATRAERAGAYSMLRDAMVGHDADGFAYWHIKQCQRVYRFQWGVHKRKRGRPSAAESAAKAAAAAAAAAAAQAAKEDGFSSTAVELFPHGSEWQLLCGSAAQIGEFAIVLAKASCSLEGAGYFSNDPISPVSPTLPSIGQGAAHLAGGRRTRAARSDAARSPQKMKQRAGPRAVFRDVVVRRRRRRRRTLDLAA